MFPQLKQQWELALEDFKRYPVWVGVHNLDFGKPWFDQCDEATYRPWTDQLPVEAGLAIVLVLAMLETKDKTVYEGFVRATAHDRDFPHGGSPLAIQQPVMYLGNVQYSFWKGRRGIVPEAKEAFYQAIGKDPADVFPIQFTAHPKLATGITSGRLDGFYCLVANQAPAVEI